MKAIYTCAPPVYALICPCYGSNVDANKREQGMSLIFEQTLPRLWDFPLKVCTSYGSQFCVIRHTYCLGD